MAGAFDERALSRQLARLDRAGRLAFALSIAERLYPNYLAFRREHSWGDPQALRKALDQGWEALRGRVVDDQVVEELKDEVVAAEPDTEDFDSLYVSPALDAAATAGLVLDLLADDDASHAVTIASLAGDTVDMYVQEIEQLEPGDPDLEAKILAHPLMQKELASQQQALAAAANLAAGSDGVAGFERDYRNRPVSNLGLA